MSICHAFDVHSVSGNTRPPQLAPSYFLKLSAAERNLFLFNIGFLFPSALFNDLSRSFHHLCWTKMSYTRLIDCGTKFLGFSQFTHASNWLVLCWYFVKSNWIVIDARPCFSHWFCKVTVQARVLGGGWCIYLARNSLLNVLILLKSMRTLIFICIRQSEIIWHSFFWENNDTLLFFFRLLAKIFR